MTSTFEQLPKRLRNGPQAATLLGNPTGSVSVPTAAQGFVVAGLFDLHEPRPLVVVTPTSAEAGRLASELEGWLGSERVARFPAWETLPLERISPARETMGQRLSALWRMQHTESPLLVVAPVKALLQRLAPGVESTKPITITSGDRLDPEVLLMQLVAMGYRRDVQVEARGDVAVRGSIVDVYPSLGDPVRVDLWGDEVDRLTVFSPSSQRSVEEIAQVQLFGCRELMLTPDVSARAERLRSKEPWGLEQWDRLANGQAFDGMESWLGWLDDREAVLPDLLTEEARLVLVDPPLVRDRARRIVEEEIALIEALSSTWGKTNAASVPRMHLEWDRLFASTKAPIRRLTSVPESPDDVSLGIEPVSFPVGDHHGIAKSVVRLRDEGKLVVVAAHSPTSAETISRSFREQGLPVEIRAIGEALEESSLNVVVREVDQGFVSDDSELAIITEYDLTRRRRPHRTPKPKRPLDEGFFDSLSPGDYVVHHHHGVGRFSGMVTREIGGASRDYLLLEYKGDDKLYVPSDQIDAVRPYTGGEIPTLHKLGGSDFARTKAKVKSAVDLIAAELVVLYQKRTHAVGHAFGGDTPWQLEMEEAFPFVETRDQLKAIAEVKADMEREVPMDRLICGDVGFGKTEVAVRAAFKAVQDGQQVAVLVPTTLLAQQHYTTFSERYEGFPVRVAMLSRFLSTKEAAKVIQSVREGQIDVLIGTHMLLSKELKFKNLGLLVLDEEQRFGVTHKEAIKELKTNIDVLTLSATPIPRTLEMSLTGIRDLTLLTTPPADRQPILTHVGEWNEPAIIEALRRELLREGQVFYVHNRVADIDRTAKMLQSLVPEARIGVAHGQMDESSLERVVMDFWEHRLDVLVCTTIIESGIDMPSVNTLVVDRADRLGLGQLHQLRGRVGRSGQRAYAYLFTPRDQSLTEAAYERLKTIGENTALGSGFKIAMRDLEIRGAGNLLGGDQSGHIAAVGYDLYVQMVNEAVAHFTGEPPKQPVPVKMELPLDASLPEEFVPRQDLRLEAYRRLAEVESEAEVADVEAEWIDRFGPIPDEARALLEIASLRVACLRAGVREVSVAKGIARLTPLALKSSQQLRMKRLYRDAVWKEDTQQLVLPLPKSKPSRPMVMRTTARETPEESVAVWLVGALTALTE